MNRRSRTCIFTALLLGGAISACSSTSGSDRSGTGAGTGASDHTGVVSLAFTVPGGITIDQIGYAILGPTTTSGVVALNRANASVEFVVGGLQAGSGYTITLTATDTAGDRCSSAPTAFSISAEQTTQVGVNLVCKVGDGGFVIADAGTGSVEIDASVSTQPNPTTVCPTIASFGVTPAEAVVGAPITVSTSTAPAGASVTYSTVAIDPAGAGKGTVVPTATGAVFTCTAPGQVQLTATTTAPLADGTGNCPAQSMSALISCETAQCAGMFTLGPALPISKPSIQDAVMGVSQDGTVILWVAGDASNECSLARLKVAVLNSGQYVTTDLTGQPALGNLLIGEVSDSLSPDGHTIVLRTPDERAFYTVSLDPSSATVGNAGVGPFAAINAAVPASATGIGYPVISGNDLEFFYDVFSPDPTVNGIYQSVRTSGTADFPAGTRMPDSVQAYGYATGESADGLSLFVTTSATFGEVMLTRASVSLPFTNPNGTGPAPTVPGWRVRPYNGCQALTTCTPGGCASEDICSVTSP